MPPQAAKDEASEQRMIRRWPSERQGRNWSQDSRKVQCWISRRRCMEIVIGRDKREPWQTAKLISW